MLLFLFTRRIEGVAYAGMAWHRMKCKCNKAIDEIPRNIFCALFNLHIENYNENREHIHNTPSIHINTRNASSCIYIPSGP